MMLTKSMLLTVVGAIAVATAATPALAVTVTSGTGTIDSSDPMEANRVTRNGVASTWASSKAFPGTTEQSPTYYDLINTTFASNALQTIYYEITYSTTTSNTIGYPFAVVYQDSFDSTNIATNYLGDSGTSASVGAPETFQVVVGAGHQLFLDFQDVYGVPIDYSYTVSAYSDANRGQNFLTSVSPTPEPGTWAMMIVGLGIAGVALRRRLHASDVRFDARIKRIAAGELA